MDWIALLNSDILAVQHKKRSLKLLMGDTLFTKSGGVVKLCWLIYVKNCISWGLVHTRNSDGHLYQNEESSFSQKLHYISVGNRFRWGDENSITWIVVHISLLFWGRHLQTKYFEIFYLYVYSNVTLCRGKQFNINKHNFDTGKYMEDINFRASSQCPMRKTNWYCAPPPTTPHPSTSHPLPHNSTLSCNEAFR